MDEKIFGVGYQRTGLSSLTAALNRLGIPTRQFPIALYKDIDHPVIHRFTGFTDNPIPLLYKTLDARWPGSRFILTVRDEESWLRSVEWLFTVGRVKFARAFELAEEVHRAMYGRLSFDRDVFLAAYRAHNEDVRRYFQDRPGDLLVLDVGRGDGFEKLCPFLGLDVPADAAFPHRNRQEGLRQVRRRKLAGMLWKKGRAIRSWFDTLIR